MSTASLQQALATWPTETKNPRFPSLVTPSQSRFRRTGLVTCLD